MDKYDYRVKTEQMLAHLKANEYKQAMTIADSIDWKRVRNVDMLCSVSDIYEFNNEIVRCRDILFLAFDREPENKKIIYKLGIIALKANDTEEALACYEEFDKVAPKDANKYILKYKILKKQGASIDKLIETMVEFNKSESNERWSFELARLYYEADKARECVEQCDEFLLWFGEKKYARQVMEMKMRYRALTPAQQAKYEEGRAVKKPAPSAVDLPRSESAQTQVVPPIPVTVPEPIVSPAPIVAPEPIVPPTPIVAPEVSVSVTPVVSQPTVEEAEVSNDKTIKFDATAVVKSMVENASTSTVSSTPVGVPVKTREDRENGQITGQLRIEEILNGWEEKQKEVEQEIAIKKAQAEEKAKQEAEQKAILESQKPKAPAIKIPDDVQMIMDIEDGKMPELKYATLEEEPEEELENKGDLVEAFTTMDDIEEYDEVIDTEYEDEYEEEYEDAYEEEYEDGYEEEYEDENYDEYEDEYEDEYQDEYEDEAEYDDEVEEVASYSEDDEDLFEDELFEDEIVEAEAVQEVAVEDSFVEEDMAAMIDQLDKQFEVQESVLEKDIDSDPDSGHQMTLEEMMLGAGTEPSLEKEQVVAETYEEELIEDPFDQDEFYHDNFHEDDFDRDDFIETRSDAVEQTRMQYEQDDDFFDDDELFVLSKEKAAPSRIEVAKAVATGKTAKLPTAEIARAVAAGGTIGQDTGFVVQARYDLETQSEIGLRAGLTEEQKKLFSYFVPVRGMSEQLVEVLEKDKISTGNSGTSKTGNLLIIGRKGSGKTVLACDVVKAIQKNRNIKKPQVAVINGEALNKKKISDIVNKLYGGALIIEKAHGMSEKTVIRLNKAMEKDTGEILFVLEDERKPLDGLLSSNAEFRRKFTSRLEVPVFINDELVTFGQTYAKENEYRIDELGILALYSRIDNLQREDHAVTVSEVKEIIDEAIDHSKKVGVKRLAKRLFKKDAEGGGRIVLSEKDFNM